VAAPLGHRIRRALPPEVVAGLLARVGSLQWVDGRQSAAGVAAAVKRCDIASVHDQALLDEESSRLVAEVYRLLNSDQVKECALPANLSGLRFVRYSAGDEYGWHTDEAFNPQGFRADLSFTLLLKSAVRGGDLYCMHEGEEQLFGLDVGELLIYPATLSHCVSRVHEGERIVLIGWIQSAVRDHAKRALLGELSRMATNPRDREPQRIQAVRNELLRRWCG
jgi:PKHD-type hydroxylase